MARIVEGLEDRTADGTEYGRFAVFPWDEWTDGQYREVQQGVDFSVSVGTFRVYLYQYKDLINKGEVPQPGMCDKPTEEDIKSGRVRRWIVRTKIVSPGVIRFKFEPDDTQ